MRTEQAGSRKAKCRNLVWHGVIGDAETFELLMERLEGCETDADLDAWHAWALEMERTADVAA